MSARTAIGVAAAVVAVVLGACSGGSGDPEPNAGILLAAGDCLALADGDARRVEVPEVVDCSGFHDGEVFARFELTGSDRPADAELDRQADEGCVDRYQAAVGANFLLDDRFDFFTMVPDADQWEAGSRRVTCVLVAADGSELINSQLAS